MDMIDRLHDAVARQVASAGRLRRDLHRRPELAFEEHHTAARIAAELEPLGLPTRTGLGKTGLAAVLDTGQGGAHIMLRADMDALPVDECGDLPYASMSPGRMHACGHDGHCACLVGAARALAMLRDCVKGKITFVFQPAEETTRGAAAMIADGLFTDGVPDACFMLHAWPALPVGTVGSRAGPVMAACDHLDVRVIGRGGHGARPHLANNPLAGLARVIERLGGMTDDTRVVSPCVVRCGEADNVIADDATLAGTIRTICPTVQRRTAEEIRHVCAQACSEFGLEVEVEVVERCPGVACDPQLYALFDRVGAALLGPEQVVELGAPSMGSEDFGYYLQHAPGLLFRLGVGEACAELHNRAFDFADGALESGMLMLAGLALARSSPNMWLD